MKKISPLSNGVFFFFAPRGWGDGQPLSIFLVGNPKKGTEKCFVLNSSHTQWKTNHTSRPKSRPISPFLYWFCTLLTTFLVRITYNQKSSGGKREKKQGNWFPSLFYTRLAIHRKPNWILARDFKKNPAQASLKNHIFLNAPASKLVKLEIAPGVWFGNKKPLFFLGFDPPLTYTPIPQRIFNDIQIAGFHGPTLRSNARVPSTFSWIFLFS